jgi:DNA-3-methyladenine glycosylase I
MLIIANNRVYRISRVLATALSCLAVSQSLVVVQQRSMTMRKTQKRLSSQDNDGSSNEASQTAKHARQDDAQIVKPWYHFFTKGDPEYVDYMSTEWGIESRGDQALFGKLSLDGAQAGLTWNTILRKRKAYQETYHGFDIHRVAQMTSEDVERILAQKSDDPRMVVVRHRGKVESVIHNAKCVLKMYSEHPGEEHVFDKYLWSFVNDKPILNNWNGDHKTMTTKSPESEAMSKALKLRGFKFVGPTQLYAFMQAVGMIVDHPTNSPEWQQAYERLKQRPGGFVNRCEE